MKNSVTSRAISSRAAAEYLGISEDTLRRGRSEGARDGYMPPPPYIRAGRKILYLVSDLDNWLQSQRVGVPAKESA